MNNRKPWDPPTFDDEDDEGPSGTSLLYQWLGGAGAVAASVAGLFGIAWWFSSAARRRRQVQAGSEAEAEEVGGTSADERAARRRWLELDAAMSGRTSPDGAARGIVLRAEEEAVHIDNWRAPSNAAEGWGSSGGRDFRAPAMEGDGGAAHPWSARAAARAAHLSQIQQFVVLILAAAVVSLLLVLSFFALGAAVSAGGGTAAAATTLLPLVAAAAAVAPLAGRHAGGAAQGEEEEEGGEEEDGDDELAPRTLFVDVGGKGGREKQL